MSGGVPISPLDGPARERIRDLLSLHAVQRELAPYKLAAGFGQVGRALDVLLAADAARGSVLAEFGLSRESLMRQCRIVLGEIGR